MLRKETKEEEGGVGGATLGDVAGVVVEGFGAKGSGKAISKAIDYGGRYVDDFFRATQKVRKGGVKGINMYDEGNDAMGVVESLHDNRVAYDKTGIVKPKG